jgi:hypothetical protein
MRTDPYVVGPGPAPPHRVRLADVLICMSAEHRPEQLFADHPGLTLVLLLGPHRTVAIGTRDGREVTLLLDPSASIRLVAEVLYEAWLGAQDRRTR